MKMKINVTINLRNDVHFISMRKHLNNSDKEINWKSGYSWMLAECGFINSMVERVSWTKPLSAWYWLWMDAEPFIRRFVAQSLEHFQSHKCTKPSQLKPAHPSSFDSLFYYQASFALNLLFSSSDARLYIQRYNGTSARELNWILHWFFTLFEWILFSTASINHRFSAVPVY